MLHAAQRIAFALLAPAGKKRNPVGKKPGFSIDDIVKNRLKQKRREELLEAVRESREAFKRGDVKSGTVAELMEELKD
jgi:hypothetical protein